MHAYYILLAPRLNSAQPWHNVSTTRDSTSQVLSFDMQGLVSQSLPQSSTPPRSRKGPATAQAAPPAGARPAPPAAPLKLRQVQSTQPQQPAASSRLTAAAAPHNPTRAPDQEVKIMQSASTAAGRPAAFTAPAKTQETALQPGPPANAQQAPIHAQQVCFYPLAEVPVRWFFVCR